MLYLYVGMTGHERFALPWRSNQSSDVLFLQVGGFEPHAIRIGSIENDLREGFDRPAERQAGRVLENLPAGFG